MYISSKTFFWKQSEDDCDELPPPPGHCVEEVMTSPNGGHSGSRLIVSPRPPIIQQKKNHVQEVQVSFRSFFPFFFFCEKKLLF